jgi:hypothetical protein
VGQSHCFRHGGGSDGGHIVDANYRIDRVILGEFDYSLRGSLWMSDIEQQDIARRDRKAFGSPLHPNCHSYMHQAGRLDERFRSIGCCR